LTRPIARAAAGPHATLRLSTILLGLAIVLVTLCAGLARAEGPAGSPIAPSSNPDPRDYRIGIQDKLNITVFQVKDLTVEKMQVDATGRILLPLIGTVQAQGKTTTELSAEIASLLRAKYLKDPQVSVVVEESASQKVTVEGAVNEAGVFALRGRTSLLEAVAMAKGPSKNANLGHVAIIRTVDGEARSAVFDLAAIQHGKARNPEILGNDIVVVDDSKAKQFWHELVTSLPAFLVLSYF
jgi:polysaccharide export outer membrane protein